ncbi:hypothetical protein ES703_57723 [subsurface metagenome]
MIKRKRLMFFIGAVLLTLAITLGLFAYGQTTATVTPVVSGQPDFVTVTPLSGLTWTAWGSHVGRIPTGDLFTITPADGADPWTGDMSVILRIANAEDLIECYGILVFKIEIWNSNNTKLTTTEYLSLGKGGQIYIDFNYDAYTPYTVKVTGGNYVTHRGGWTTGREDPTIYCQVLQRSAP